MKRVFLPLALFLTLASNSQVLRKRSAILMGGKFEITIVDKDSLSAESDIDEIIAEIRRIEYLISDWKSETQISEVNRNAGISPVKVDQEVLELTKRAIHLSEITNGAFDISFAAMDRIWKFDGSMEEMPTDEAIKKSVEKVDYKNIVLDSVDNTIFLRLPGMKIGFGALGEGYAADRCKALMLKKGVQAGIINGTGDMNTWGKQLNGKPWNIAIKNPFKANQLLSVISLNEGAITTSGSYEKFVEFYGKRYSHIINPKTGYPATGLISVTVLGPSAEVANGFSTSIMVLGKEKGVELIKNFPDYQYLIITESGKIFKNIQ